MQQSMTDHVTGIVSRRLEQEGISLAGRTVLCAVSGGRDSIVLLHILLHLSVQQGFIVCAAHFNHHLRETAQRDETFVRERCAALGVPFTAGSGDVAAYAAETGTSIEDAARTLRYAFLQRTAEEVGADYIATGHHRQDNAETLLLHLLRGSGLKGLGGIALLRGNLLRPLLDVDRAEIDACTRENALPYVEDETNADTVYTRNRIRLELLPLLEEISPGSVSRIADTAQRLRADEAYLQRQADGLMDDDPTILSAALLKSQASPIAARMVRAAARKLGAELTSAQTDAVLHLKNGACLSLGGGVRAARAGDSLQFYRLTPTPAPMELTFGTHRWGAWHVTMYETNRNVAEDAHTVVLRSDIGRITLAAWDGTGRLAVENGRRTVKRLFVDRGIPPAQRENAPALYADGTLIAVFGAGTERSLRGTESDTKLVITLEAEV